MATKHSNLTGESVERILGILQKYDLFEKRRSCVGLQLWPLRCSKLWRICNKDIVFARVVKGLGWKRKKGNIREIEIRNGFPGDIKPSSFSFFFLFCHHHNHQFSCLKIWRFAANWHVVKNIDGVATSTPPCEYLELMKEIVSFENLWLWTWDYLLKNLLLQCLILDFLISRLALILFQRNYRNILIFVKINFPIMLNIKIII